MTISRLLCILKVTWAHLVAPTNQVQPPFSLRFTKISLPAPPLQELPPGKWQMDLLNLVDTAVLTQTMIPPAKYTGDYYNGSAYYILVRSYQPRALACSMKEKPLAIKARNGKCLLAPQPANVYKR